MTGREDVGRSAPIHPLRTRLAVLLPAAVLAACLIWGTPATAVAQEATADRSDDGVPVHTIAPGETLSEIAQAYGIEIETLMILNGIGNADAVYAGQALRLPEGTTRPAASVAAPDGTTDDPPPSSTRQGAAPSAAPADAADEATGDMSGMAQAAVDASTASTLNQRYVVQFNDTLADIALRLGISHRALSRLNRLAPDAPLVAGQELLLPATAKDLQVTTPAQQVTVAAGDSLSAIAVDYGVELAAIMRANGLSNPNNIFIGQALVIPPQPVSPEEAARSRVGPPRSGFDYYTVLPGDTLSEISRDFNTPVLALLEYNGLPDEQTVYAGLELRIPYGSPPLPRRHPPVPISGTSFMVSLSRQQCWLFHGDRIAQSWTCSTGYGEWITRTGTFNVQTKLEMAKSGAYRLDMPYWLGIYDVGEFENGIHGIPVEWETGEKLWDGLVGQPATFGCAMLADDDAAALFAAAYLGMPIHVIE